MLKFPYFGKIKPVCFLFLVLLVMLLLVREKSGHRFSNDHRRPSEMIMFGDHILLPYWLVHLSFVPYVVKTVDLVFICL